MGLIQNLIKKYKERKNGASDLEENYRIQKQVEQKQLSSNEREYNRYLEEYRQRRINSQLQRFRKRQQDEWWHGKQILDQKNIFKNNRNIFKNHQSILTGKNG